MNKPVRNNLQHSKLVLEELEERRLFSGGIEGLIDTSLDSDAQVIYLDADTSQAQQNTNDGNTSASAAEQQSHEIVFIDDGVDDYQQLVDDIYRNSDASRNIEVVILDRDRDGIEQISAVLLDRNDLDAIHIISHGSDGNVELGNTSLNTNTLTENNLSMALWANAFAETGDILIYGCNLAASEVGQSLIADLGALTLTDVAASDDLTGHTSLGGDWELEYSAGVIESSVAINEQAQQNFAGVLDITTGLQGHWKLDETSGTTAVDSSGNGNDGTLTNMNPASDWVPGQINGALDFDGNNDYVNAGSDASIDDVFTSGGTVSAWIYLEGWGESDFGRITDKSLDTSATAGWSFQVDGASGVDRIRFETGFSGGQGGWATPTGSISLNNWYHVAAVYNSGSAANDATIYINGTPQTITEVTTPSGTYNSDAAYALQIGGFTGALRTFDGLIDDVRIYDRALDGAEIAQLANNVQPTISASGAATVNEGEIYTLNLSTSDPIDTWTINWGDGAIDTIAGNLTSATHTYTVGGLTNNITVSATDSEGTYFDSSLIIGNAATGTDGFLLMVGYDPATGLADIAGAQILNTPTPSDLDWAVDVIVGPNGDIYATGYQSGNVVRFDGTTGAFVEEFVTTTQPVSIAFGPNGNLFVASDSRNREGI